MSENYFGGIPTKVDVERLIDEIGIPKEGDEIPYDRITQIIGVPRQSFRWGTVTSAWRKVLYQEHNLVTESVPGKAIKVLVPGERIRHSSTKYKNGMKTVYRAGDVAATTDISRLPSEQQRAATYIVNASATLRLAAAAQARKFKVISFFPEHDETELVTESESAE
jgi:hypothetical protein